MKAKVVRREFLTCRVSREEKQQIEEKADEAKKDVSTYVREILLPNDIASWYINVKSLTVNKLIKWLFIE